MIRVVKSKCFVKLFGKINQNNGDDISVERNKKIVKIHGKLPCIWNIAS